MIYRTDDPHADFLAWDSANQEWEEKHPKCDYCGEHILEEHLFDIQGEILCEECMNEHYRKETEKYMED